LHEQLEDRARIRNLEELSEIALISAINSTNGEPETFKEAMMSKDSEKWTEAIKSEFDTMRKLGVWHKVKKETMGQGKKGLGTKWVFKRKNDGQYRARLVAKGYNQIPGVDFTESHSPVCNDVAIRVTIAVALLLGYVIEQIDVEAAFLNGLLDNEVYISVPEGYKEFYGEIIDDEILKLDKSLYGTVTAARIWMKTFTSFLIQQLGFERSWVDPCLLWKQVDDEFLYIIIYVDDCLIVGEQKNVKWCKEAIKESYAITEAGMIKDYVGADYKLGIDSNGKRFVSVNQTKLIEGFEKKYNKKSWNTPGAPGTVLLEDESGKMLTDEDIKEY